jgi:hypothetical protein
LPTKATPGQWKFGYENNGKAELEDPRTGETYEYSEWREWNPNSDDIKFMVASRMDLPRCVKALKRAMELVDEMYGYGDMGFTGQDRDLRIGKAEIESILRGEE